MMFRTPIHHMFAPLADEQQHRRALALSYAPWRYLRGPAMEEFTDALSKGLGGDAFLFATGREALLALLQSIRRDGEEEVIVQGYTCVVVPNAIQAAGMVPVYCDIERDTLNLDLGALEKVVTPRTRAIICQHTFGIPADTKRLRAFCDKHSLLLIEDCAHAISDASGPQEIGTHGDFLMLSFGRDKAISGITGGAIICKSPTIAVSLAKKQSDAVDLPWWTVARLLEYPNVYALGRALYGIGLGRIFLFLTAKIGLLLPILNTDEKESRMSVTLHRMPNICAALALEQFKRLRYINDHRRMLTKFYLFEFQKRGWSVLSAVHPDLPLQKFPTFLKQAEKIRQELKKQNIFLHDGWTGCVVCPATVSIPDTGYELGNDPEAEAVCEEILSLPTHPTMAITQARRLMQALDAIIPVHSSR